LVAGAAHSQAAMNAGGSLAWKIDRGALLAATAPAKHDCKGQNACKGQGGCSTGNNGCKGKNSCKGKGGCATNAT
jgi:hypothetical protein